MKSTWSLQQEHWAQGFLEDKALLGLAQTQQVRRMKEEGNGKDDEPDNPGRLPGREGHHRRNSQEGSSGVRSIQGNRRAKCLWPWAWESDETKVQFLVCLFLTMVLGKWLLPKLILGFLAPRLCLTHSPCWNAHSWASSETSTAWTNSIICETQ